MILVKTIGELQKLLFRHESAGESIGFVPTMGALHDGHIQLIHYARKDHPVTVCSIFVNPTQFNNATDFEKYPSTIEKDIDLLEQADCTVLFMPSVDEMYPPHDPVEHFELGFIETILEGKYRPGHFQGVCRIVDKLLEAVKPDTTYIGQKDYQQCSVIRKMIELKGHRSELRVCETVREPSGLAMSSRNLRLTNEEQITASAIYQTLGSIRDKIKPGKLNELKQAANETLTSLGFMVDYVEIANATTLEIAEDWNGQNDLVALVAATLNEVRLIDNLLITNKSTTPPGKSI